MRVSMALFALSALCVAGCERTQNPVTEPGKLLVEWDITKATRASVVGAAVGERASKDYTVRVHIKDTPPFALSVHVETAPIDYVEEGKKEHQLAPVAIKATVKENTGWDLSGKCVDGPHYQMPLVGHDGSLETPLGMIQECRITNHRVGGRVFMSSWEMGFSLNVFGDGHFQAFPPDDVTIEPG